MKLTDISQIKVGQTLIDQRGRGGVVEALETELGPDYASVRFGKEGFAEQIYKQRLLMPSHFHFFS